jgi:hypothetical protein
MPRTPRPARLLAAIGLLTLLPAAPVAAAEVVVLSCSIAGSTLPVRAVSRTAGAPAITVGSACAVALAELFDAGFRLLDVRDGRPKAEGSIVYTAVQGLPACNDGEDNDGDGLIDLADPQCTSSADVSESS